MLRCLNIFIRLFLLQALFVHSIPGCKQPCYTQNQIPGCPYSEPVWYPDGSFLGFNHQVVKSVSITNPCYPFHSVTFYDDSNGFWLINRDGTHMRRVTTFQMNEPAWSPDGHWIAFGLGTTEQIFKMYFDGTNFDTSHIVALTNNSGSNFHPSWSPQSDTIYYESNQFHPGSTFQVYKMASDGTGQILIGNKGPDSAVSGSPFCTSDKTIIHTRVDHQSGYIFSMNTNGYQVSQLTQAIGSDQIITYPTYYNNNLYYQNFGIWNTHMDGSGLIKLCMSSTKGFSISKDGIIAYSDFGSMESSVVDKTHGVIWTMNIDGTNQQPLTFNNY
jgi:hypothetical protein